MLKPSQYIAAAVRNVRDRLMDDCRERLTVGEHSATVTRASPLRRGEDEVSDYGVAEAVRVLALASDFPRIDKGAGVTLGDSFRVVTSVRTDCAGASKYVGLSYPFEKAPAAYSGTRREAAGVRQIRHPLDVLMLENGTADTYANAFAPSYARSYTVAIRREDWPEVTDPDPSDQLDAAPCGRPIALKVSSVTRHDGWYILKCRTRE